MKKLLLTFLFMVTTAVSAEVIATYQDIEGYDQAAARLGRAPEVSEFERYDYEVSSIDGKIVIALVSDQSDPLPEPEPEPAPGLFDRTSKQQMLGCLTRWNNQLNAESFETVLNSLSSMFSDKEKINFCIEDIRKVIEVTE